MGLLRKANFGTSELWPEVGTVVPIQMAFDKFIIWYFFSVMRIRVGKEFELRKTTISSST